MDAYAAKLGSKNFEVSAITGQNIELPFQYLCSLIEDSPDKSQLSVDSKNPPPKENPPKENPPLKVPNPPPKEVIPPPPKITSTPETKPVTQNPPPPKLTVAGVPPTEKKNEDVVPNNNQNIVNNNNNQVNNVNEPQTQTYPYSMLISGIDWPQGINTETREQYLSEKDFFDTFKMSKANFNTLPGWKKTSLKKQKDLF